MKQRVCKFNSIPTSLTFSPLPNLLSLTSLMSQVDDNPQPEASSQIEQPAAASSIAVPTSDIARQRRRIADLEEKLQVLKSGHAVKQRYEHHRNM